MAKVLYLVHGKPGSGKTTASKLAAEQLGNVYHFSMGEELRARALHGKPSRHSEELQQSAEALKQELPVPHHLVALVFAECIETSPHDTIIIDGYPVYADRLPDMNASLKKANATIRAVCVIDVPDEVARQRLSARKQRSADVAQDDAFISKRLEGFRTNVVPILEILSKDYPVHNIDGQQSPDMVSAKLANIIKA